MENKKSKGGNRTALTVSEKVKKYSHGNMDSYSYKYNYFLNIKPVVDNGWDLDCIDLIIFDIIKSAYAYQCSKPNVLKGGILMGIFDIGHTWAFISEGYILESCPLLPISDKSAVRRRLSKLIECGLIIRHPDNKAKRQKYVRLGENASLFTHTPLNPRINSVARN